MALGKAVIINSQSVFVTSKTVPPDEISNEISRFKDAVENISAEIQLLIDNPSLSKNVRAIIESNLMMLNDEFINNSITAMIEKGNSAEQAVVDEFDNQKQFFLNSTDTLIKERTIEVEQLKYRIIRMLRNQKDIISAGKGSVVIAQFVNPEEVVKLHELGISAIITEIGGITAHSAILARSYEIPQVIGIHDITSTAEAGDFVIVDGYSGQIKLNPSPESMEYYSTWKKAEKEHKRQMGKLIKLPAETIDKRTIKLKANINLPDDIKISQLVGAEGIGLVRTEYLVITKGHFPGSEEQYEWYKDVADKCYPQSVTFRVFDVGSDKIAEGLPRHEANPALGFRGIRFLLQRTDIFKSQVLAILRASSNKNVRILLPMITSIGELDESIIIINACKEELTAKNLSFDKNIPIGVMIETPGAALISDSLAAKCNFLSIGTNDLTQYTLAVDRTNEIVAKNYDSFHPAVLSLIKTTIDAAKKYNIEVSICGELAGHSAATSFLVGLGVDELSIAPTGIPEMKKRIRDIYYSEAVALADKVLATNSPDIVKSLLEV